VGTFGNSAVNIEAVCSGEQGKLRLIVPDVTVEFFEFRMAYVRGIAAYQIEFDGIHLWEDGVEQVSAEQLDAVFEAVIFDVFGGDSEGIIGDIGCDYSCSGEVFGDCYGDAATACAEVADELGATAGAEQFYGALDEQFGFRTWNQAARGHFKLNRVEFCFADKVLDGFILGGAFYKFVQLIELWFGDGVFELGVQFDALHLEDVTQQQFCAQPG